MINVSLFHYDVFDPKEFKNYVKEKLFDKDKLKFNGKNLFFVEEKKVVKVVVVEKPLTGNALLAKELEETTGTVY